MTEHLLMLCLCCRLPLTPVHVCNSCRMFSYLELVFVSSSLIRKIMARFVRFTFIGKFNYYQELVVLTVVHPSFVIASMLNNFSNRTGSSETVSKRNFS